MASLAQEPTQEPTQEQINNHNRLMEYVSNPVPVGFNGLRSIKLPSDEKQRVCYMTYGRFQPCHKGHLSLFNNMCQLSKQEEEEHGGKSTSSGQPHTGPPNVYVFVSHTGGPDYDIGMPTYKENPLDSGDKRNLIYEQVGGSDDLITIIDCATLPLKYNGPYAAIAALQACYDKVIVVLGGDRQTGHLADVIKTMVGDENFVRGGKLDGKGRLASGTNTRRMTWDNNVGDGKKLTAKPFAQKDQDKRLFVELVMGGVGQGYQDDTDGLGPAILPFPPNISQARIDDLFYKIKFSQPLLSEDGKSIDKEKEKLYRGFVSRALALGKQAEDAAEPANKKAAGITARVEFFTNETCDTTTTSPWKKKKKKKKNKLPGKGGKRTKKRKRTKRRKTRKTKRRKTRKTKRKSKRKRRKTKRKKRH